MYVKRHVLPRQRGRIKDTKETYVCDKTQKRSVYVKRHVLQGQRGRVKIDWETIAVLRGIVPKYFKRDLGI